MIDPPPAPYPVRLTMQYPERLSRLSTAFRIILAIPVLFFVGRVSNGGLPDLAGWNVVSAWNERSEGARNGGFGAGALVGGVVIAIWATILVRERIPHWLFDFQAGVNRFTARAYAYFALLTDQYPAFEGDWVLNYDIDYPDRVSRWKVLFWKLFASIPHFIVLIFLGIAAAGRRRHQLVHHPFHRRLPPRYARLRRRRHALGSPRHGVLPVANRCLPAPLAR